ncbi:MAG: L-threonylcarbamoyladenylate synthase [Christensenellales bacterium]|jgi:L-threonylcarbamoyladenylate synthase
MNTACIPASAPGAVARAAALIRAGELVGFPTETVYGLGANALDGEAVRSIFAAKGRPADNPLIAHIAHLGQLPLVAQMVPPLAWRLMAAFWPGPLTLLLPRAEGVPDVTTAGLSTVGVRMPAHPVARALIAKSGLPIAAPSGNRSGAPSPTRAAHMLADMDGRIPLILDGGPCSVGVESTVVDATGERPVVLRPGGVTVEMLQRVAGRVDLAGSILRPLAEGETAASPGMKYKHYAPRAQVTIYQGAPERVRAAMLARLAAQPGGGALYFQEDAAAFAPYSGLSLGSRAHVEQMAARLFDALRRADELGWAYVLAPAVGTDGMGLAVMNRMGRAAAFDIQRV